MNNLPVPGKRNGANSNRARAGGADTIGQAQAVTDTGGDPFTTAYEAAGFELDDELALQLAQRFAYVLPQPPLIAVVARYAPVVEIGAGTGYWAHMLRRDGVDTVAYDQAPPGGERENRYHPGAVTWSDVVIGDATALAAHADRALLLCWPPLFSDLGNVLSNYAGNIVIYVGDRGQRTAWPLGMERSHELLERHPAVALDPMPGSHPELSVWRRRV